MVKDVKYSREFCEQSIISEGGIRGIRQHHKTAQIYTYKHHKEEDKKTESALKLAKNS